MDQQIVWLVSLVAVLGAISAVFYEWKYRPRRQTSWRVMLGALALLAMGTFVVSSEALIHDNRLALLFAGFNRAILAGCLVYIALRTRKRVKECR